MITEIFSLLSSSDVGGNIKGKFDLSLNKRRVRSISAFSSNSIFYFPVVVSDQCTLEEVTMMGRALEKQYATFVVSCISLMPFHRIRSDDQASVEDYLQQFHQNMGISASAGVSEKILSKIDSLDEAAVSDAAREFFGKLWESSRANQENPIVHLRNNYKSLCEMYGTEALDDYTKILVNRAIKMNEEMSTWGFIGEDAPDMYYPDDMEEAPDYHYDEYDDALMSEAAGITRGQLRPFIRDVLRFKGLGDNIHIELNCHSKVNENGTVMLTAHPTLARFDPKNCPEDIMESVCRDLKQKFPVKLVKVYTETYGEDEDQYGEIVVVPDEQIRSKMVQLANDPSFHVVKPIENASISLLNGDYTEDDFNEMDESVKQAITAIKFQLESVPDNKIKSCSNLTKLRTLESKLNTLKKKYAKYLKRYKRKYNENKKNGTKQKLAIRFNGMSIDDPKAFMKQYGTYIKIINKKLKLVEKRRTELRKKKGITETADEPDFNYLQLDYLIETIDHDLDAPDNEVFYITEDWSDDYFEFHGVPMDVEQRYNRARERQGYEHRIDTIRGVVKNGQQVIQTQRTEIDQLTQRAEKAERDRDAARKSASANGKDAEKYKDSFHRANKVAKGYKSQRDDAIKERDKLRTENEKLSKNQKPDDEPRKSSIDDINITRSRRFPARNDPKYDPDDTGLHGPRDNIVAGRAREAGRFGAYQGERVFTDMEMKKANDMIPTFTKASIGFIVDETEEVVTRDILIGIKTYVHRAPTAELVDDLYSSIISRRKFLKFVKFVSGEEKSLADLLFGIKELKLDATSGKTKKTKWKAAFQRRKRWKNMAIPYLMKEYTPNGTIVMTMNEVEYIKEQYGVDLMMMDHIHMLMDTNFLLGFVILDQANEIVYVTYDGFNYQFQEYSYAQLEREQAATDRMMRELYRSFSR